MLSYFLKIVIFFFWAVFLLTPFFYISAASDLDRVWLQEKGAYVEMTLPIETGQLGNFAELLVYLMVFIAGSFAIMTIFIGMIKMKLASGNDDNYDSAKHSFISGLVTLFIALVLFFSLDLIFSKVGELASKIA
jgi:hypothetical protein